MKSFEEYLGQFYFEKLKHFIKEAKIDGYDIIYGLFLRKIAMLNDFKHNEPILSRLKEELNALRKDDKYYVKKYIQQKLVEDAKQKLAECEKQLALENVLTTPIEIQSEEKSMDPYVNYCVGLQNLGNTCWMNCAIQV